MTTNTNAMERTAIDIPRIRGMELRFRTRPPKIQSHTVRAASTSVMDSREHPALCVLREKIPGVSACSVANFFLSQPHHENMTNIAKKYNTLKFAFVLELIEKNRDPEGLSGETIGVFAASIDP